MARQRAFDKNEVIRHAMQLFWTQGYQATSIRDLKEAMGISSSSMYEAFGDKRGVYLAALALFCELERQRIIEVAASSPTPQLFIEHLFTSLDPEASNHFSGQGSMAFNAMVEFGTHDPAVTELLLTHYLSIVEIIAQVIKDGQTSGRVTNKADAHAISHTIVTTLQGTATIYGVKPNFAYIKAIMQVVIQLLG